MRTVIYVRISEDRTGEGVGVDHQERDCRQLAHRLGADVIRVLSDNDISASRFSRKVRPGYAEMLQLIEADQIDLIIAQHPDRLYRRPAELEHLVNLVEQHRVGIETYRSGMVDLTTATGRVQARIVGAISAYESDTKSERIRGRNQHLAADGHPHGMAPFGWTRGRDDHGHATNLVDPAEAAAVRDMATRVIAGDSLSAIARDLNAAGLLNRRGKDWATYKVRRTLLRPSNAGLREHHGRIVADGTWEPLLDRGTWEQCVAILTDPLRTSTTGPTHKHLLTGIAVCGVCRATLVAAPINGVPHYRCAKNHVGRKRGPVDAWVEENLFALLSDPAAAPALRPAPSSSSRKLEDEAQQLRTRLDGAAASYARGAIDEQQLAVITSTLRPQLDAVLGQMKARTTSTLFAGLIDPDIAEVAVRWSALPIARKRAVVRAALTVEMHRTRKGRLPFDPATVVVRRRQNPGAEK